MGKNGVYTIICVEERTGIQFVARAVIWERKLTPTQKTALEEHDAHPLGIMPEHILKVYDADPDLPWS